jgi:hypothetical protein
MVQFSTSLWLSENGHYTGVRSQNVNNTCQGLAVSFPDENRMSRIQSMNGVHMETRWKGDSGWPLTDRQARSGAISADFELLFHQIDPYWERFGSLKIKNRINRRESQRKLRAGAIIRAKEGGT